MSFYENSTCFFKLQTKRKSGKDFVAVGSSGNILAWNESDEDVQKWLIVPDENDRCRILTKQNGEHMAVGSNGNILRWGATGNKDQQFTFIKDSKDPGWYNIKEFTRGQRVAVGSNGNILRWGKTGHNDQRFKPKEVDSIPIPSKKSETTYDPGTIPKPPEPHFEEKLLPPESSEKYTIGKTIIPSVYIRDSKYITNADDGLIDQVIDSPYYLLKREQYWTRIGKNGSCKVITVGKKGEKIEEKHIFTISQSTEVSAESTLSIEFSISNEIAFTNTKNTFNSKICKELKTTKIEKDSIQTIKEINREYLLDAGVKLFVNWELRDLYSLYRINSNGKIDDLVASWDNDSTTTQEFQYDWDKRTDNI